MQGRSRLERDLWDAGEVTGHLVPPGSVFAFLAEHRTELFPDEFTADLFTSRTGRPSLAAIRCRRPQYARDGRTGRRGHPQTTSAPRSARSSRNKDRWQRLSSSQ